MCCTIFRCHICVYMLILLFFDSTLGSLADWLLAILAYTEYLWKYVGVIHGARMVEDNEKSNHIL